MHVPLSGFDRRRLDGAWALELFGSPDDVPAESLAGERRNAARVEVPGNWTMQDLRGSSGAVFEDKPHYTNVEMPFLGPPPRLPERNPTGVYRRTVNLPDDWRERRWVLHVGGAESVHAVFANGRFAGYGTDSRLPSEYGLDRLLCAGVNELAIVVVRFSAHSYIEDQDQWWMAGLHRSVWLEARPVTFISDLPVSADYDHRTGAATIAAAARIDFGEAPRPGWSVRFSLRGPSGAAAAATIETPVPITHEPHDGLSGQAHEQRDATAGQTGERGPHGPLSGQPLGPRDAVGDPPAAHEPTDRFKGFEAVARWHIGRAEPWNAERPRLYAVTAELLDPDGAIRQVEAQRVGARRVEVRDRALLVNGRPVRVFGVNRHDHHPDRGKAVTAEDIRADLRAMRAHNINSVRTSHYPNDSEFYRLCDHHGFYVVDEADIECHAHRGSLCDDPTYRSAFVERGARMVRRDRNHPSILMWSLGNESGYGVNHAALAAWIRAADPSRPLHYEGALEADGWERGGVAVSDVACPMYPEIEAIRAYGTAGAGRRPLIMCEYSHAMGNSNGSLADYWEAIESTDGLQGGFLWEFKDQALRRSQPDGHSCLAYGGHFGDFPNDGNFAADGLMSADLEAHPAMREVAWVYRPVKTSRAGDSLRIENRRSFDGLADLTARWQLLVDGEVRSQGELSVPEVAPLGSAVVALPCAADRLDGHDGDAHLNVLWETVADDWYAPAGHLTAWDQIELRQARTPLRRPLTPAARSRDPEAGRPRRPTPTTRAAAATRVPRTPQATGANEHGAWAPAADASAVEQLVSPRLNLWRAPTDNDGFKLMADGESTLTVGSKALARWRKAGLDRLDPEELVDHRFEVERDGHSLTCNHQVDLPDELADAPRVGVLFTLPSRFTGLRWHGRGAHENYPDRKASATVGVWHGAPDELPYLVPQEFGLRSDCRWFELIDPRAGEALLVEAVEPGWLHFSATHHTPQDLSAAATRCELRRRGELVICVDSRHRGLGTASCGPDVLDRYKIPAGRHEFSYRLSVLSRTRSDGPVS